MKKIMTIIGARPQIIKAAAISRAIRNGFSQQVDELIVHTGQHYDENMSAVFFDELGIPKPFAQLAIGSGTHGNQTGAMLSELEQLMINHHPDAVIVYGDTNSTLAGALAASKLGIPVIHIEAGLRSFNKAMPEEINRIMTDHVSTLLFSPTRQGMNNLGKEGFALTQEGISTIDNPKTYHCGDIMYDNSLYFSKMALERSLLLQELNLEHKRFILVTIHRNTNTDDPKRLSAILEALLTVTEEHDISVVLPLHPRTRKYLSETIDRTLSEKLHSGGHLHVIDPVGFLDMIVLEHASQLVVTDSGGVQKEAFFFQKPCVVLREETEWVELIESGAAVLAGADKQLIVRSVSDFLLNPPTEFPPVFGDGKAAEFICETIVRELF